MRLYLSLALVGLDWCFRKLILCMYMIIIFKMMITCWCYIIHDIIWWWLSSWTCNWGVLLMYVVMYTYWLLYVTVYVGHVILLWLLDCVRLWGFAWSFHLLTFWRFMSGCLDFYDMVNSYSCLWCYSLMIRLW